MNKSILLLFFAASLAVACNKKMVPATTKTETKTDNPVVKEPVKEEIKASEPEKKEPVKVPDVAPVQPIQPSMPTIPNKPSDEESGKNLYTSKCGKCHALKNTAAYTYDQWEGILKSMIPNAKLTADEETQVVAYIRAHAKH
ncbi:MAG: cytochrome c [Chitinophagaceae bacterium]